MWGGIFVGAEIYAKRTQPQRPTISLDIFAQSEQSNATLREACLTASVSLTLPRKVLIFFTPFWMQSDWVFFSYSKIDKIPYKDYTIDSIFFIPVIFRKMFSINLSGKYKKYMDWILIFMISFIISCKLYYKTLLLSCLKILVLVFFFKSLNCYKIKLMSIMCLQC